MAIDKLQDRIRKLKNPSMIEIAASTAMIPPYILQEEGCFQRAFLRYCKELMDNLKNVVPAIRIKTSSFTLMGVTGLGIMGEVLELAKREGFYVLLDGVGSMSKEEAEEMAMVLLGPKRFYPFDGLIISSYIGSDGLKPYVKYMQDVDKDVFVVVRTSNKSASEIQDLLTGTRVVHMVMAEIVSRLGENMIGKCGYSSLGIMATACAPDSLKALRAKHEKVFILADGYDCSNANAKTASYAFDQFGHGAVACSFESVMGAWKIAGTDGHDFVQQAVQAAERMKKNLQRYVTVM